MRLRRPTTALMACAMLLPLAACYDDNYGPRGYGPPPPPPPPAQGGYYDRGGPPPGYWDNDRAPPPNWDPSHEYRPERGDGRALTRDDRVYRGSDGRYYCRRSDGTTGTVVGAVAGGALGAILGGGGALGTILGAGGGALLGRSIDKGEVHCK